MKVKKAGEIYWIYPQMTDGDKIRHLTSVWMRKDTEYSFYNFKKKSSIWNFSREYWFILNQFIKTKLRNRLCKNKEDKIFFLYIAILRKLWKFNHWNPNLYLCTTKIQINNVLELLIFYSVDQINCWLTCTLRRRHRARGGAISRL